jgi:hypothetical protein
MMTRDEQIARSVAWLNYVHHRKLISGMTDGSWDPSTVWPGKDWKEILKYHRRIAGEMVKLYPDFPARADRRGIPGHDTHNPKKQEHAETV